MPAARYVDTIARAMKIGAWLATTDDEDSDDGAQDAALAFLELQASGVNPIPLGWLLARIKGCKTGRARRSSPLRHFSARSQCEPLPVWAQ